MARFEFFLKKGLKENIKKGETLVRGGEEPQGIYFLESGIIKTYKWFLENYKTFLKNWYLFYFNQKTLRLILEQEGFEIVFLKTQRGDDYNIF